MTRVAIDLGASRTRLAVLDPMRRSVVVHAEIPTVAYINRLGHIAVGQEAIAAIEADPAGGIDDLKERIGRDEYVRHRRLVQPTDLASLVIAAVRRIALDQVNCLDPLTSCVLCAPAGYSLHQNERMRDAALRAGFARVYQIDEAVAAARAFERSRTLAGHRLVVCDLGQSARITMLRRESDRWSIDPTFFAPRPPRLDEQRAPRGFFDALQSVVAETTQRGIVNCPLLLVGGNAGLNGLAAQIERDAWPGDVHVAVRPEHSIVTGAVELAPPSTRSKALPSCPQCDSQLSSRIAVVCGSCSHRLRPTPGEEEIARLKALLGTTAVSSEGTLFLSDYQIPELESVVSACLPQIRAGLVNTLHLFGEDWRDRDVERLRDLLLPDVQGRDWVENPTDVHIEYARWAAPGLSTLQLSYCGKVTGDGVFALSSIASLSHLNLSLWTVRDHSVDSIREFRHLPALATLKLPAAIAKLLSFQDGRRLASLVDALKRFHPEVSVS